MVPSFETELEKELWIANERYQIATMKSNQKYNRYLSESTLSEIADHTHFEEGIENLEGYISDIITSFESTRSFLGDAALKEHLKQEREVNGPDLSRVNKALQDDFKKGNLLLNDINAGKSVDKEETKLNHVANEVMNRAPHVITELIARKQHEDMVQNLKDRQKELGELKYKVRNYKKKSKYYVDPNEAYPDEVLNKLQKSLRIAMDTYTKSNEEYNKAKMKEDKKKEREMKKKLPKELR